VSQSGDQLGLMGIILSGQGIASGGLIMLSGVGIALGGLIILSGVGIASGGLIILSGLGIALGSYHTVGGGHSIRGTCMALMLAP
jgi:hypothetical protein